MTREPQIAEEAAAWIHRLNQPVFDTAAGPDFDAWMAAAPRHREVFAELQALWQSDALVTALGDVRRASGARGTPPLSRAPSGRLWRAAPPLAAACAGLAAIVLLPTLVAPTTYRTDTGDGKTVVLADGSRVDMSGDTELRVSILPWSRSAVLVRGEAFFDVRHETRRAFRVSSDGTSVRVLGTAFNVDRQSPTRTSVAVYRGAVEVRVTGRANVVLRKGQGAQVVDGKIAAQPARAGPVPDWKSGWFEASDIPLGVLIGKVQRYSTRPIVVEDGALQALPISGRFHISDPGRVLQAVHAAYQVDVIYGPKAIAIRPTSAVHDR